MRPALPASVADQKDGGRIVAQDIPTDQDVGGYRP